jgi:hypothetical protein
VLLPHQEPRTPEEEVVVVERVVVLLVPVGMAVLA